MSLFDRIKNRMPKFTFKNHYGKQLTMSAKHIYVTVMQDSEKSDYNWLAPAIELVKLCKNPDFPREYALDIEIAILNCFANIEARVNRGGDKYVDKPNNVLAVQYCYDHLGQLALSADDEKLCAEISTVRARYLKQMISSAVNTTTRGCFLNCEAFRKLKEETIKKYFNEYIFQTGFNIKDMYEQISEETEKLFDEAFKNGEFKKGEDEFINIVKMLTGSEFVPEKPSGATFKGYHAKHIEQELEKPQITNDTE